LAVGVQKRLHRLPDPRPSRSWDRTPHCLPFGYRRMHKMP
jgi:hypothetical protein